MKVIRLNASNQAEVIKVASETLAQGGLVIFPTETTYGAGAVATNQAAVDKLLAYKARREGKPMSIAVTDLEMAEKYVEVNESARRLYERFLPGPVTVVSKSLDQVAQGVASEFGTLGVRIPAYPLVIELVQVLGVPITATSANASGEKRPYTISDILNNISEKQKNLIDLIIDAGELPPNPPSTVIDTTLSTPVTLRQGEIKEHETLPTLDLTSNSEVETKSIAARVLLKHWDAIKNQGLVIGLDGPLGAGKTIFAKGAAEFLHITDTVTSPTYTYIEEYDFERHGVKGTMYHLDLWKIDTQSQLERLQIEHLLRSNNVVIIEWWSQVQQWLEPILTEHQIPVITANISEVDNGRLLRITGMET